MPQKKKLRGKWKKISMGVQLPWKQRKFASNDYGGTSEVARQLYTQSHTYSLMNKHKNIDKKILKIWNIL